MSIKNYIQASVLDKLFTKNILRLLWWLKLIIYADELILKNFVMTYLILLAVKNILKLRTKRVKQILGATLASIFTLIAVIYEKENNIIIRISIISLLILISYSPKNFKIFFIETSLTLAITFLIGGVMSANINNLLEIILCGIFSIISAKEYNEYYKNKKWQTRNNYDIELKIKGKIIKLKALLDTGNFLKTSFENEPVIIISQNLVKGKIPEEILKLLEEGDYKSLDFETLKNLRIINYGVLNKENSICYGLKVKNVKILKEDCEITNDAVIMLSKNKLKNSDAIIGINLLEGRIENGNSFNIETKSKEIVC